MKSKFFLRLSVAFSLLTCLMLSTRAQAQWSTVGSTAFSPGDAEYTSIAIGTNDTPFVAFRDAANSFKQTVMKYNSTSWVSIGTGISAGNSSYSELTINSTGTPYLAYGDGANSGVTVLSYNNTSWSAVGSAGFSGFSSPGHKITVDNNDTPYVVFDYNNTNAARVMKYNGSSWVYVGSAFNGSAARYAGIVFDSNNDPYVAFNDAGNSNKATVKKYNGSSWTTVGSAGFSAGVVSDMSFAISDNDTLYLSYRDAGNSNKLTVMKYNGSSWVAVGSAGVTSSDVYMTSMQIINEQPYVAFSDGASAYKLSVFFYNGSTWGYLGGSGGVSAGIAWYLDMAKAGNGDLYASYQDYGNGNDATVMKYHFPSTTWNGTTWSGGAPTSSLDAIIASGTAPSSFTCKNLTINGGVALNTSTNVTATIHGTLTNNGNGVTGTGTLTFAKTGTTTLAGTAFEFGGTVTVSSGCTLATADRLTLSSTASNTGRIGNSAGSISGNITIQRYVPGKRAFRFLSHPFTASQALSAITDDIDITGTGGTTNGFTATATNNPSAYWFDVSTADGTTAGNNPGWTAFTHTNGVSTNSWDKGELIRVLVRGAKGEGLTGVSYTPSAATLDMTGTVNTGTQVITLTKGSGSTFVSCGNPLPSPVQMNTVAKGSSIGANYYVWDATSGANGAYITNAFSTSYILPMGAALFTTASANSNNTLTFEEADKSGSTPAGVFKTTAANDWVELLISDSTLKWDRLLIHFDDNSMDVEDKLDAVKLYNPGLDFFTLSKDGERLAIDVRPYSDKSSIPLGLTAYNRYNKYVIRTGDYSVPAGTKLILHDKYLKTQHELKAGFEYWFDVTADTLSQGNNRFEINMLGKPTSIISAGATTPMIQLIPNPARSEVKASFDKLVGKAQVKLMNVTGQVVYAQEVSSSTGSIIIPLSNIPTGMYIVELQSANARFTEKLIKE